MLFRKKVLPVILAAAVVLSVAAYLVGSSFYREWQHRRKLDLVVYCSQINQQIKDKEFSLARISEGDVLLFDQEGGLIETVHIDRNNEKKDKEIKYIYKMDEAVYFVWIGIILGEEIGFIFVNDGSDQILDGIDSLERVWTGFRYHMTGE